MQTLFRRGTVFIPASCIICGIGICLREDVDKNISEDKIMKKYNGALLLLSIFLASGSALFLLLPYFVTTFILPPLIGNLPFAVNGLRINHITPWSIQGNFSLSHQGNEVATLPNVDVRFSIFDLLKGEIDSLTIEGATFYNESSQNSFLNEISLSTKKDSGLRREEFLLPIRLNKFSLKNCLSSTQGKHDKRILIGASATAAFTFQKKTKGYRLLKLKGSVVLTTQTSISTQFSLDAKENGYKLSFSNTIPNFSGALHLPGIVDTIRGSSHLKGNAFFTLIPFELKDFSLNAELPKFILEKKALYLANETGKNVTLKVKGNQQKAKFEISNLSTISPLPLLLSLTGEFTYQGNTFNSNGKFLVKPDPTQKGNGFLTKTVLSYSTQGSLAAQWEVDFLLHSLNKTTKFSHDNLTLTTEPIKMVVQGSGAQKHNLSFEATGKQLRLSNGDNTFHLPTFQISSKTEKLNSHVVRTFSGKISKIFSPQHKLSLHELTFSLPLTSPQAQKGMVKIEGINFHDTTIGTIMAETITNPTGIDFFGNVTEIPLKPMKIEFSGHLDSSMNLEAEYFCPPTSVSTTTLPSALFNYEFLNIDGELTIKGQFSLKNRQPQGSFFGSLSKGNLSLEDQDLEIKDIFMTLDIPELTRIESEPNQLLTIGTIDYGNFHLSHGRIHYRLEDTNNLFIEKSQFSWCGGNIESGSLRLTSALSDMNTTLYCDRLSFTELLQQFNVSDTEGGGTLNGKLPIQFSSSGFNLDGGFLFSTPGNSGIIRFNNTALLKENMPDIDKAGYLDYSLQALKNFSYNWTRLSFSNQNDSLLLAIQINGKPEKPLPFAYKQGRIIPSQKGSGMQHPIRLDINFLLPLEDIFKYGSSIKSYMENMR